MYIFIKDPRKYSDLSPMILQNCAKCAYRCVTIVSGIYRECSLFYHAPILFFATSIFKFENYFIHRSLALIRIDSTVRYSTNAQVH